MTNTLEDLAAEIVRRFIHEDSNNPDEMKYQLKLGAEFVRELDREHRQWLRRRRKTKRHTWVREGADYGELSVNKTVKPCYPV